MYEFQTKQERRIAALVGLCVALGLLLVVPDAVLAALVLGGGYATYVTVAAWVAEGADDDSDGPDQAAWGV